MRILIVSQRLDAEHDVLGFFTGWVEALAGAADGVEVIAQWLGDQPPSAATAVHSLGKERGLGKPRQLARLQRILWRRLVRERAADLVLCHMCPEYVPLCAPLARAARVPLALWYTHGTGSARLRLAVRLADRTFTASLEGFPRAAAGPNVIALGHGIDTHAFPITPLPPDGGPRVVLSAGRISPVKGHQLVVRAFATLLRRTRRRDLELRIVGGAPLPEHRPVARELERLVAAEGLEAVVSLPGPVPYPEIHRQLAECHVFASASDTGSLDKAVLEAMACGRPVLTSNPAFGPELSGLEDRLIFRPGDVADLADKLESLLTLPRPRLEAIGLELAGRVAARHDLRDFARRLVREARRITGRP